MSLFFSSFTGFSPAAALFEGTFFTTFLIRPSETRWKGYLLFNSKIFLDFNNTRMIRNNILRFVIGDIWLKRPVKQFKRICNWFKVWIKSFRYFDVFSQNLTIFSQGNFESPKECFLEKNGASPSKKALNLGKGLNYHNAPA